MLSVIEIITTMSETKKILDTVDESISVVSENLSVSIKTEANYKIEQQDYDIKKVSDEMKLNNSVVIKSNESNGKVMNRGNSDMEEEVFDPLDVCTVQIDEASVEDNSSSNSNIKTAKNTRATTEENFSLTIIEGKFCTSQNSEPLHQNKIENNKKKIYTCNFCNKTSKQKSDLAKHLLIHYGTKPFSCDTCNKSFNLRTNLNRHMLTHSGEKPYVCVVCSKVFRDKSNLNAHKLIHSKEKPFSCDRCKLSFNQKQNLIRHQRTHTGDKPFTCNECKKAFSQKSSLMLHMHIHTGEKPYTCSTCPKSFSQKTTLAKHMKIHKKIKT